MTRVQKSGSGGRTTLGLLAGAVAGIVCWPVLVRLPVVLSLDGPGAVASAAASGAWSVVQTNLRGSLLPFAVLLVAYAVELWKLSRRLSEPTPRIERVIRHEQLVDLCANLFFGIGVVWTAIGMRAALVHALSDPAAMSRESAFTVLQRLVEGGVLLALSTTIVGGIGGYLMRVLKSLLLGSALGELYVNAGREPYEAGIAELHRIRVRLDEMAERADVRES